MLQGQSPNNNLSEVPLSENSHDPISSQSLERGEETQKEFGVTTPRQMTMITIGGAINTGLMIGVGDALSRAGPASILISYTFVGIIVFLVLCALGEVASLSSKPFTVAGHAGKYCGPALGFTLGWIYWLKFMVVIPNQLTAGTLILSYWTDTKYANSAVWITLLWAIIVIINYWGSRFMGKFEFVLSSFKIMLVLGLIILAVILTLGGGPDRDRRGFRYWADPGAFASGDDKTGLGVLRAILRSAPSATFSYLGSERIGMAILHTQNPRKAAAQAIKLNFYRILIANIVTVTLLGMVIPYDEKTLAFAKNASKRAAAPAFVVAVRMAHISALPDILNACFLLFVISAAVRALCMATMIIYELALEKNAPAFLCRTNKKGVPIYALGVTSIPASLAYLNISHDSAVLFGHFVNIVTMFSLLTWVSILIVHISFVRSRNAHTPSLEEPIFKAPLGVVGSWIALAACIFITIMRGFELADRKFYTEGVDRYAFMTSYLGVPLYIILVVGYKAVTRRKDQHLQGKVRAKENTHTQQNSNNQNEDQVEQSSSAEGSIWEIRCIPLCLV